MRQDNGESLYTAEEGFRPFPSPNDVFASRVDEHAKYLLPAASVSLARIKPDLTGWIHFLLPIEPYWSSLGEHSQKWHNRYCFADWLGYRMIGNRCEFLADFRYFHKALYADTPPTDPIQVEEFETIDAHYARMQSDFALRRAFFREHGWLHSNPETWTKEEEEDEYTRAPLVTELGGVCWDGNWSGNGWPSTLPISRYPDPNTFKNNLPGQAMGRVCPRSDAGRDFIFIGSIDMWNYFKDTNGTLFLFCEPVEQLMVSVIDWS